MDDGAVALGPDPPAALRHEAVVLGAGLALLEHCEKCFYETIFFQRKKEMLLRVTCMFLSGTMSSVWTYWYKVFSIRSWGS